jgi:hypothetical protein
MTSSARWRELDARQRATRAITPVADALHQWLRAAAQKVPEGSATIKAIDYSLNRWQALTRYIDDGDLPDRQQLGGEPDPADCARAQQLAVRRISCARASGPLR